MKCEICHKNEAKVAIHKEVDGKIRELYVCGECAAAHDGTPEGAESPEAGAMPPEGLRINMAGPFPAPPELLSTIFGEFLEDMEARLLSQNPTAANIGKPCPTCGMTPMEFHRQGRLGCPDCYKHLFKIIAPVIHEMHKGSVHTGKFPGKGPR